MKAGDIVRYAKFPHEELYTNGMVGLILAGPYQGVCRKGDHQVDVMWCDSRDHAEIRGGNITWEYADELEVLNG